MIRVIEHRFEMKERGWHSFPMLYISLFSVSFFNVRMFYFWNQEIKVLKYAVICFARKMFLKYKAWNLFITLNYPAQPKSPPKCSCLLDFMASSYRWLTGTQDLKARACHIKTQIQQYQCSYICPLKKKKKKQPKHS